MGPFTAFADPASAHGMCAVASFQHANNTGASLIQVCGSTYPKREHWANIIGDIWEQGSYADIQVIDFTARQFVADLPFPYEGTLEQWLDDCAEWLGDSLNFAIYESQEAVDADSPIEDGEWNREDIDPDVAEPRRAGLDAMMKGN